MKHEIDSGNINEENNDLKMNNNNNEDEIDNIIYNLYFNMTCMLWYCIFDAS